MDVRATGKSRSQRINLDHFRQKTWLTRSRGLLALSAGLVATCYCFFVYATGTASHLSTGPVAAAHASFENDCQKCHLDFTPIAGDALRFASSGSLDRLEEACQQCHRVKHHFRDAMKPEFAATDKHCSGCHTDHQGRANDMVNIASNKCTQCHADLAATCVAESSIKILAKKISEFTREGHGEFASLTKDDPGRIKFDHAQHMLPGQVDEDVKGGFTIAMLEANFQKHYRELDGQLDKADNAPVTLTCIACHQFAGQPGQKQVGDDEVGRHIQPIAFEQHCAACHSMSFVGRTDDILPLPHAAPWKEVELLLASKIAGGQLLGTIRMPRDAVRAIPVVGEPIVNSSPAASAGEDAKAINEALIRAGLAATKKRCAQCHDGEDFTDESIVKLRAGSVSPLIPERWLAKGIYDHAAHRKVDCKFCHADAYAKRSVDVSASSPDAKKLDDSDVVMIDGIETCSGCHRAAESSIPESLTSETTIGLFGGQSNWASNACIECHRYHWERPVLLSSDSPVVSAETPAP